MLPGQGKSEYFAAASPSNLRREWDSREGGNVEIEMDDSHISSGQQEEGDNVGLRNQMKTSKYPPTSRSGQLSKVMSRASSTLMGLTNLRPSSSNANASVDYSASNYSVPDTAHGLSDGSSSRFYPRPVRGRIPSQFNSKSSLDFQSTVNSNRSREFQSQRPSLHYSDSEAEVISFPYHLEQASKSHDVNLSSAPSVISIHGRAYSESTITPSRGSQVEELEILKRNMISHQRKESLARQERAGKAFGSYI